MAATKKQAHQFKRHEYETWKNFTLFLINLSGGSELDGEEFDFHGYWTKGWDPMSTARQFLLDVYSFTTL